MRFTLPNPNQIRGDQLADEILQATGIVLERTDVVFYPPDEIVVPDTLVGEQGAAIQAVIDAHVPDNAYFPAEQAASQVRQAIIQAAGGAVGKRFDQLTAAEVRALFAIVLHQAGALDSQARVRPLSEWA